MFHHIVAIIGAVCIHVVSGRLPSICQKSMIRNFEPDDDYDYDSYVGHGYMENATLCTQCTCNYTQAPFPRDFFCDTVQYNDSIFMLVPFDSIEYQSAICVLAELAFLLANNFTSNATFFEIEWTGTCWSGVYNTTYSYSPKLAQKPCWLAAYMHLLCVSWVFTAIVLVR